MGGTGGAGTGSTPRWGGWQRRLHRSQLFLVGVAVACGVGGAFAAIVFRVLIRLFTGLFFGGGEGLASFFQASWLADASDPLALARALPWWAKLAIPALGA